MRNNFPISSEQRVPYGKILLALAAFVVAACAFGIWMGW